MGNRKRSKTRGRKLGKVKTPLNKRLQDVEWGKFKIIELFNVEGTKSLDRNAINFVNTGINFVGRTFENNGIQGKIKKQKFEPNLPFSITATVIGNYKYVKYQQEPYYCSQNINKLSPKKIFTKWNYKIAYYFVGNIQKFVSLYNNQQGGYKLDDIKNHIINVPTAENGKIDFDFIESFVTELEVEKIVKLDTYLSGNNLTDYKLSDEEKRLLDDFSLQEFEEFKVPNIFEVKNTANILSRDIIPDSGETPYLCASSENNGVSSYITYDEKYIDKGNCVFIGGKTFVVSYQEKDFFSNDSHNLVLYLKENIKRTKLNQLFLTTCINKSLSHKYSWGDSISNTKIKKDKVSLPVKDGKPDYVTMENVISAIHKLVIKDVVLYVERKKKELNKLTENANA